MTNSIEQYRQDALIRAQNKVSSRILNDSLAHANILIDTMVGVLPTEADDVGIYTGLLPKDSFFSALNQTKAKAIKVVVDDANSLAWLNELDSTQAAKISVYKIDKPRSNHFFYTTAGAFRFETDSMNCTAEANFNEMVVVDKLEKALSIYQSHSTKIFPKE
jgi:hypothetical protein